MPFDVLPFSRKKANSTVIPNLSVIKAATADGSMRVRVTWGTANDMQAVQHSSGDAVPLTFAVSGKGRIYGELTGNHQTRRFTAFNIINHPSDTNKADTTSKIYKLLGSYDASNPASFVVANAGVGNYEEDFSRFPLA